MMIKNTFSKGLLLLTLTGWLPGPTQARPALPLSAAAAGQMASSMPETHSSSFRFMTYNIHNGIGMDNRTDYRRIAQEILRSGADIVAVQEVDSATNRSKGRYVLGELALETQMYPIFGKAISIDKGKYGIGLLCRRRPLHVIQKPLPGREEKRTLLIAEFESFYVACTHWSLKEKDRMTSAKILCETAASLKQDKPLLLAGDLNATPDSPEMALLSEHFTLVNKADAYTYPADKPVKTIDYIAVWKPSANQLYWSGQRTKVIEAAKASDHRPVVAEFRIKTPAAHFFYGKPYLQNPATDGITVMFQTRRPSHCWVEFTTDSTLAARGETADKKARALIGGQVICHDIEQKIRLEHLEEGQTYYYRVCAQELLENRAYYKAFGDTVRTPYYRFTLPSKRRKDFTAIVLNDMHCSNEVEQTLARLVRTIPHDLIFVNGDCLPEPADREEAITNINRLSERFGGHSCPIIFIRGNHEIRNAYSSGMPSLFDYPEIAYDLDAGRKEDRHETDSTSWQVYSPREAQKPYGSFSWGNTRFVYMDCGEDKPDDTWVYYGLNDFTNFRKEQAEFLKKEIRSREFTRSDSRILLGHIPIWGNTDKYQPCPKLWRPILEKADWNIGMFAHTHQFRFYEKDSIDNPFPVYVGGGPSKKGATLAVIRKKGKELTLEIYNAEGKLLKQADLD